MSWQHWIVVGFLALSAILNITTIGEERKPTTPGLAAAVACCQVVLVLLVAFG